MKKNTYTGPLIKVGQLLRLKDIHGKQASLGDKIRYSTTDGRIVDEHRFTWDEINQCLCVGNFPFYKLMESAFIQSTKPGRGNFDFEIFDE